MKLENFISGEYKNQSGYKSFTPSYINKIWTWDDSELNILLENANRELGSLNSYSDLIPNIDIYIKLHLKTEAHKSSKIEGTKTSMEEDLMKVEDVSPEKRNDRIEVQNYINAINEGIIRIVDDNFPLSSRLIRELHCILLQGVRGEKRTPGEFIKSQNWIGGSAPSNAVFVPPHHSEAYDLISDMEFFLNDDSVQVPTIMKIGIAHYQFETIHPFLDGNGRIGRLIIPLYLLNKKVLSKPCFYISDFFERNKTEYYDSLTRVRTNNDIISWIKFFLKGVIETSESTKNKFHKVVNLVNSYRALEYEIPGKSRNIAKVLDCFYNDPILSINDLVEETRLSRTAITSIVNNLYKKKIVEEITGYQRNKLFLLTEYFKIFAGV